MSLPGYSPDLMPVEPLWRWLPMRLLRTTAGEFMNAAAITRLQRDDHDAGWHAILADGNEVLLASYYNAPNRIALPTDIATITTVLMLLCTAHSW